MKPIGIASMFIVAAVLVGIFSNTVALPKTAVTLPKTTVTLPKTTVTLPKTMSINIYAIIDTQLDTSGTSYEPSAKTIVTDAETLLNQIQETSFELRIKATTRLDIQSNGETWIRTEAQKHYGISADLYVIFTSGSLTSAHNDVEGKMCHAQKEFRTIILPNKNSLNTNPTRDLVFNIGRLLGMTKDKVGRKAKDGNTVCNLGNMLHNNDLVQLSKLGHAMTQKWNECNKEELKDFYKKQMANEPWGFCLDKDVTLPKIGVDIHTFYDPLFDENRKKETRVKQLIYDVVLETQNILNNGNTLGTTFELRKVQQDRLDNSPNDFNAMTTISNNQGSSAANFYVFFTKKLQMPEAHPELEGKICSGDRAHRTVSLTRQSFSQIAVARQLAYYIGRTLGMDTDGMHNNNLNCNSGYMSFKHKTNDAWSDINAFFHQTAQWNKCNAEDLSYFFRQFLRSDNPGQEWRNLCVAKKKMIITIGAGYITGFQATFKNQVNSRIGAAVKEAENLLNQDAAMGGAFQLTVSRIRSTPITIGKELTSWTGAGDDNNLYIVFKTGKWITSPHKTSRICTATRPFRTAVVHYHSQWEYTLGMQVASIIGQLLGMKKDTTGRTARDGTTCRTGLVAYDWYTTGIPSYTWTQCDVQDLWNYYRETIATTGSFCLDRSTFKG